MGVTRSIGLCAAAAVALTAAGCGLGQGAQAHRNAERLVSAARAEGVGANVTVKTAEALYGSSANAVCDVFKGSGSGLNLPLNPGARSFKIITSKEVKYGRLVVQVYCPRRLAEYDRVIDGLHIAKSQS